VYEESGGFHVDVTTASLEKRIQKLGKTPSEKSEETDGPAEI